MREDELNGIEDWVSGIFGVVHPVDVPRIAPTIRSLIAEVRRLNNRVKELECSPHVIGDAHLFGDQEIYYGVNIAIDDSTAPVTSLASCVCEDYFSLSDENGDHRDVDEFYFVVGPFPMVKTKGR